MTDCSLAIAGLVFDIKYRNDNDTSHGYISILGDKYEFMSHSICRSVSELQVHIAKLFPLELKQLLYDLLPTGKSKVIVKLIHTIENIPDEMKVLSSNNSKLKKRKDDLKTALSKLRNEHDTLINANRDTAVKKTNAVNNVIALRSINQEQSDQIMVHKKTIERKQKKIVTLQSENTTVKRFHEEMRFKWLSKSSLLEEEVAKNESLEKKIRELNTKYTIVVDFNKSLREDVTKMGNKLAEAEKNNVQLLTELAAQSKKIEDIKQYFNLFISK